MKCVAVFPCVFMLLTTSILADSASAGAAETLIVALGASSTAGKGVGPEATYPAQLQEMLKARGNEVRILNAGVNGNTSAGMLARLDNDVPNGTKLVILQTGTNDSGQAGHDKNIVDIIDRLRARSIRYLLLRTKSIRDLRRDYSQADGHHLTAAGYRILAMELLPLVERDIRR